jgi:2,4-dienoyl-CoA reductase-like NADH-dependent reductase (Old Yellow Enzyme family)
MEDRATVPHLFSPLEIRSVTLRNRIVMAPMCMSSASENGHATDWHLAHYTARAIGGVGLILIEAAAVEMRGRLSMVDLGLWDDGQIEPLARIVRLCQEQGAALGIQLAHSGRKAWSRMRGRGRATPVAPSAIPFDEDWVMPHALAKDELADIVAAFVAATRRAEAARFDVVQIHAAHGYLLHEFLSPLSNQRTDEYGGSLENRSRLLLETVEAVRATWPARKPLLVRLSATDWIEGGLTIEDQVRVARWLWERGVDAIDCSTGGITPESPPDEGPGFQVRFAEQIRRDAGIATIAVGLITTPELADAIVREGRADMVALGRELLRHPQWPLDAAHVLRQEVNWPRQYESSKPE